MSRKLYDFWYSKDDGTTESDEDEYPRSQLPEVLELDLTPASEELVGVRGSGNLVLADQLKMVSVCDLPLKEFLPFYVLSKEDLSAEVLALFEMADGSRQ